MRRKLLLCEISCLTILVLLNGAYPGNSAPLSTAAESLRTLRNQALEKRFQQDLQGALDAYEQALSVAKREFGSDSSYVAAIYYDMGSLALEANKFQKAEDYLTESVTINPNSVAARIKLAQLLITRERPQDAAIQAQQALRIHPNSASARQVLALAYLHMEESARLGLQEFSKHPSSITEFARFENVVHGKPAPQPIAIAPLALPQSSPIGPFLPPMKRPQPKADSSSAKDNASESVEKKSSKEETKHKTKSKSRKARQASPLPSTETGPNRAVHEEESKSSTARSKSNKIKARGGLVPPPPPAVPTFPTAIPAPPGGYGLPNSNANYRLSTKATQIKPKDASKDKSKKEEKSDSKEENAPPAATNAGADDDFLLDWADKGSKKKK